MDRAKEPDRASRSTAGHPVLALQRGLDILDLFLSDRAEFGVNSIAQQLPIHKSTVSRLCATLEQAGYLERNEQSGTLRLGRRIYQLAGAPSSTADFRHLARPILRKLVENCGETAHMGVLDGLDVVTVEVVDGFHSVRMQARLGRRRPVHASALGKAILGSLPVEQVHALIRGRTLVRMTSNTITEGAALIEHLGQVRERGYSVDLEEMEDGLRCVAAPVYDHAGHPVAAISVSGPRDRFSTQAIGGLARLVRASADEVSSCLGAPVLARLPR